MKYIDVMAEMQLELAGEYLLMAAMLAEIKSRMLLPRPPIVEGADEEDPRAELVRRLQEYERFKKAAEDIDQLTRMERDTVAASVELAERKIVRAVPQVSLQEMLMAFKDVLQRADMFAHHHVNRERLSVRQRMSDILSGLRDAAFMEFVHLFRPEEGRMGVTVTFIAILELMKEGLIEIVQSEPYAPIHVRPASGSRHLALVANAAAAAVSPDVENEAALAQPELPDEHAELEEDVPTVADVLETNVEAAVNESTAATDSIDTGGADAVTPADDIVTITDEAIDTEAVDELVNAGKLDGQH
jgi:segregation and condensation protein A